MNKLLATLVAGFFAVGAFAQAAPAAPVAPAAPMAVKPAAPAEVKPMAKATDTVKKAGHTVAKKTKKGVKAVKKAV